MSSYMEKMTNAFLVTLLAIEVVDRRDEVCARLFAGTCRVGLLVQFP